jgi:hypothetical protein
LSRLELYDLYRQEMSLRFEGKKWLLLGDEIGRNLRVEFWGENRENLWNNLEKIWRKILDNFGTNL